MGLRGGICLDKDWRLKEENIRVQEIVRLGQTLGVTLTNETLNQLKMVEGEKVQVEVREHELIIRKIISDEPTENFAQSFFQNLNESLAKYETISSLKRKQMLRD